MNRLWRGGLLVVVLVLNGCAGSWTDERPSAVRGQGSSIAGQYTVQKGDTLYSIAFRYQVDFHDLAEWNRIGSDYLIYPGQMLRLRPSGNRKSVASAKPAPRVTSSPRVSKPRVNAAPPAPRNSVAQQALPPATAPTDELERYFDWQWPLKGVIAKRYAPDAGAKGLDIEGEFGQAVIAAAPGRVVYSGSGLKGYGELVIIKHDEAYLTAYGYNRKRLVQEGDLVAAGQAVAELGLGPAQKPMLHFEIRNHGRPIDPLAVLPKAPDQ